MCNGMPDVIVIGGGVMGLAAARELRGRGHSVSILERATPGRAASWASAGIIGATTRDENDPGYNLRRLSRELWPGFAAQLEAESGLDPEYRENGCLYLATDESERLWLQRVAARDSAAEFLDERTLHDAEPAIGPRVSGALRVSGGNVDPRRLCRALEIAVRRAGVEVRTATIVDAVTSRSGRVTGVQVGDEHVAADLVVLAAGAWSSQIAGVDLCVPVHPQKGQIFALDQTRVSVRHVLLTAGDPYLVPRCDGRLVVGATREEAGWDASLTAGGIAWLLNRAMQVVPALSECSIAEMWTGFRPLSEDGIPLIGAADTQGLYLLTGHGPSGISPMPGTIALLMAIMHGDAPPISGEPFNPRRFAAAPR
jgi:glycine oxidase